MRPTAASRLAALVLLAAPLPAFAADEAGELWLNPSFSRALDDATAIEIETAQRLREEPRNDTYFVRLWYIREDPRGVKWSLGAEQRWNGSDEEEVRLLQQAGYGWGPLDFRTRLEQRFVSTDPDTGWRLRQRVGSSWPLGEGDDAWSLSADAEVFMTLQSTEPDGQTGLTGLRTFIGFERSFGAYELSLGYLRQQDIRKNRPDRVGHAPFIGLGVEF